MPDVKEFKSLFKTPQKTRLTVVCVLVALVTVGAIAAYIAYSVGQGTGGADAPPGESEAVSGAPAQSGDPAQSEAQPSQDLMGIVPTLTIEEARELAQRRQEAEREMQVNGQPMALREDLQEVYVRMSEDKREQLRQQVPVDSGLLAALKAERYRLAQREGVPAYIVFSNAVLSGMAARMPHRAYRSHWCFRM